jgi:hypothetical protein
MFAKNSGLILGWPTTKSLEVPLQGFLPLVEMTCLNCYKTLCFFV